MVIRARARVPAPMLTEVSLRNFKAFGGDVQTAPMSRITLLYGPNSGGKSSIIQALLLLKQSEGNPPRGAVLTPQGEFVDLAGFRAMAHRHIEDCEIEITVKLKNSMGRPPGDVGINLVFGKDEQHATDLPVLNGVGFELERSGSPDLGIRLKLIPSDSREPDVAADFTWADEEASANSYVRYVLAQRQQGFESGFVSSSSRLPDPEHELTEDMIGVLKHVIFQASSSVLPLTVGLDQQGSRERERRDREYRRWERKLQDLELQIHDLQLGISGTGAGRRLRGIRRQDPTETVRELRAQGKDPSERLQELVGEVQEFRQQEPSGLRLLVDFTDHILSYRARIDDILGSYRTFLDSMSYLGPILDDPKRFYLSWGSRRSTVGKRGEYTVDILSHDDAVRDRVNGWFDRFSIPYRIIDVRNVAATEFTGALSAMVLEDSRTGTIVTPVDVGFGISQILPVIVEGVAGSSSIVCVDQPEVHLHPKLQAEIADLMVECSDKQWVVESHSELLVRRILRRIAEGKIEPSDVSVLYVDPPKSPYAGQGSTIEGLNIEEGGKFSSSTPWPQGFFEDGYREMMAAIRAGG